MQAGRITALTALLLAGCRGGPGANRVEIRYDGSTTISGKILQPLVPTLREKTGTTIHVDRSGSSTGVRRMFGGQVDVAGVSRRLTAKELERKPYFQIIAYDGIAVWVNDSNPVRALTKAQLKSLFTGAATSWNQVGGKDLPVVPCTEQLGSGRSTLEAVQTIAMDGAPYGRVKELEDAADCLAFVAKDPRGVAAASATGGVMGARAVSIDGLDPVPANIRSGRYLLTRPLLLVARGRPPENGPLTALFEMALSPEGQASIASAGFVPAR